MKPPMKLRLLRALADGLEAAPEIADEFGISREYADVALRTLWQQRVIERERRPTFYLHGDGRHAAYRYRLRA